MDKSSNFNYDYEYLRQAFLNDLARGRLMWMPTKQEHDKDVDISRIYRSNPDERLALLRIKPGGFRASRAVPQNTKLIFDSVLGRVAFLYKGKQRIVQPGKRISIAPSRKYSARSLESNDEVFLLLRVIDVTPSARSIQASQPRLAIEATKSKQNQDVHSTERQLNINSQYLASDKGCDIIWTPKFSDNVR